MLKVLIIGGTGNISSSVSRLTVEKGYSLTILNRGNNERIEGAEHITGDAGDERSLRKALAGRTWDVAVDFIAFNEADALKDIAVFSGRVGQFIFISSASCYAKPVRSYPINESVPLSNPYSPYAQNKIKAEMALMEAFRSTGFPVTIVRPSHTYATRIPFPLGAGSEYTLIDRIKKGLPVVSPGDGTSLWTVTHSDDFAKGITGLFGRTCSLGNAYNITSDEALTWDGIYAEVGRAVGMEPEIIHAPSDVIAKEDPSAVANLIGDKAWSLVFDNSKIKKLVPDFIRTVPFSIGCRRALRWFDEKPERKVIKPETNAVIEGVIRRMERAWS